MEWGAISFSNSSLLLSIYFTHGSVYMSMVLSQLNYIFLKGKFYGIWAISQLKKIKTWRRISTERGFFFFFNSKNHLLCCKYRSQCTFCHLRGKNVWISEGAYLWLVSMMFQSSLPCLPGSNQSSTWSESIFSNLFLGRQTPRTEGTLPSLLTCNVSLNFSDHLKHLLRSIWCFSILCCMRPALHIGNSGYIVSGAVRPSILCRM